MHLEVEATYENGTLKLDRELPLQHGERVKFTVHQCSGRAKASAGIFRWQQRKKPAAAPRRRSGYILRQAAQVERFQRRESRPIPTHYDYAAIPQLRHEAKEKLGRIRPGSLGHASRISGICPADLAVLLFYLDAPRGSP